MTLVTGQALTGLVKHNVPKSQEKDDFDDTKPKSHKDSDMGGWSFLQSLCCNNNNGGIVRYRGDSAECTDNKVYVHPLAKRSASKLTEKSLKMCTESLGCESGSENGDDISLLAVEAIVPMISPPKGGLERKKHRMSRSKSFPPPLKSASGSNCGHIVRSYRENGRLVVKAIRVSPPPPPCFVANRSEGRLRLCFLDDSCLGFDNEDEEHEEKVFNCESYEEEEQEDNDQNEEEEEEEEEENEEEEEEKVEEEEAEEGIEENNENFEGKIGTRKFRRPSSRCKENGHEQKALLNWKQQQFWVAT